jgi:hypothetical protein
MSNILAMPMVGLAVTTSNNEDWIDSIVYYVDTGDDPPPQLDIRGIIFEMEIRRSAVEHEVLLTASTADGTLKIGAPPAYGYFLFNIPVTQMRNLIAGTYVGDITGRDGFYTRTVASVVLTVVEGITKQPVVTGA